MKKSIPISPVIIELAIVTLFFALSATTLVQLIFKAGEISDSAAVMSGELIALESAIEEIKADPAQGEYGESGVWAVSRSVGGVEITGTVTRTRYPAGSYYEIALTAPGDEALSMTAGRYVSNGEAGA